MVRKMNDAFKEAAVALAVSGESNDDGVRKLGAGFCRDQNASFWGRVLTRWGPRDDGPSRW